MTREQLEHAIRAACDVAKDTELIIFGSQAILGEHPDAPPDLRASVEVDIQPRNRPEAVDIIDGNLGELSKLPKYTDSWQQRQPVVETAFKRLVAVLIFNQIPVEAALIAPVCQVRDLDKCQQ